MKAFQASYYEPPGEGMSMDPIPRSLYRDSSGRIRIDSYMGVASNRVRFRRIFDPISNSMFLLNDLQETITIYRYPPNAPVAFLGNFPIQAAGQDLAIPEELGSREIEGFLCRGQRIGSTEYWVSAEFDLPLLVTEGKQRKVVMRIFEIVLTEPGPEVFAIPDHYRIEGEHKLGE